MAKNWKIMPNIRLENYASEFELREIEAEDRNFKQ